MNMTAPDQRSLRGLAFLVVVAALVMSAAPALADHDWAAGCSSGNTCWREVTNGGGNMQSDHRDSWTYFDVYAGNSSQNIGDHTDWFKNRMNVTHAHVFRFSGYSTELFCVGPADDTWIAVPTTTGSWNGGAGAC